MRALGVLERKARRLDYAEWRFDEAAAMYKSLGVRAPDETATSCGPVAAATTE
jgi:hypothetical protein